MKGIRTGLRWLASECCRRATHKQEQENDEGRAVLRASLACGAQIILLDPNDAPADCCLLEEFVNVGIVRFVSRVICADLVGMTFVWPAAGRGLAFKNRILCVCISS